MLRRALRNACDGCCQGAGNEAYTQEMQAKVVEAQAKVPTAMAEALANGRLGVMDYYRLNIFRQIRRCAARLPR